MRILVVDDEQDIRTMMRLLLEHHGHTVDAACNGVKALEAATANRPDLVLLDLNMPVMDGFTAAQRLRERADTALVHIVAVSAYVHDKSWCDRAIAAGVNECLSKPLNLDQLQVLLQGGSPRAQSH